MCVYIYIYISSLAAYASAGSRAEYFVIFNKPVV